MKTQIMTIFQWKEREEEEEMRDKLDQIEYKNGSKKAPPNVWWEKREEEVDEGSREEERRKEERREKKRREVKRRVEKRREE